MGTATGTLVFSGCTYVQTENIVFNILPEFSALSLPSLSLLLQNRRNRRNRGYKG